ncbi:hypothetical protein QOZ80_1AG0020620 [Eleusine coracana subsp. coracana]|nr:hypothetical protein QOZ80_1AG0020620 [Eleusine coracana subsp. coracana]
MEMAPYSFHGGDADWYGAVDNFPPLLGSASSPLATSEEDNLLIPVVPSGPLGLRNSLLTTDSSSSAMMLRDEDNYHLPMFPPPAPPAAGDPFYFDRLPPIPVDGSTTGLDNTLLMQPFSDIDLEAFCGVDEHKPAPNADNTMIAPANLRCAGGQHDAGVDGDGEQKPMMAIADCYRPAAIVGFDDMTLVRHGEHHHHGMQVAALAPMPQPLQMRRSSGNRSVPVAGKTRLDHIGLDEIRKYFYMPITKAAREMNVGLTVLKKRCRELGVARWPHRKMKSLRALILNVQEMGKGLSPAAVQRELEALETYCALMEEDPSIELTDRTKKLRQACFKESYKRRRAASVNGVMDQIYNFGDAHQLTLQEASSTAGHSIQSGHFFSY